jgi:MYXO-CTERM domain-containing protein
MHRFIAFGLATLAFSVASSARAHFILQAPACWESQDSLGNPQKLGPCGNDGAGTPTNMITPYKPGDTVTITVNEVIFHPGHYRIALSVNDRSELPPEPTVTPGAGTPCGTVPVESPAMFPVLADGVFDHTAAFGGPQTIQVKLPTNVTCKKCTLQVLEFMSQHPLNNPGGCFYHHCADISIDPGNTTGGDAGGEVDSGTGNPDGGSNPPPMMQNGCACSSPGSSPALSGVAGFFALAGWLRWRRRKR